jgi:hypothetical protein
MLKLEFKVDKYHLAYKYILKYFNNSEAPSEWIELKRNLTEEYEAYPAFLFFEPTQVGHGLLWFNQNSQNENVIRDKDTVNKIFESIFQSEVFKRVYLETENYKKRLEEMWIENTFYVKEYENIIHMDISINATILVLHPEIETGSYIGDNVIEWGNPDLYENYQIIGLCREILHLITEKEFNESKTEDEKWLLHSLIYLSADEELRQKINGYNGYFMTSIVDKYHPRLIETANKFLLDWKNYVANEQKSNIVDLYKTLCVTLDIAHG